LRLEGIGLQCGHSGQYFPFFPAGVSQERERQFGQAFGVASVRVRHS